MKDGTQHTCTHVHGKRVYRKPLENVTCILIQRNLIRIEQQLHSDFIHSTVSAHQFRYVLYLFFVCFILVFHVRRKTARTHTHTSA